MWVSCRVGHLAPKLGPRQAQCGEHGLAQTPAKRKNVGNGGKNASCQRCARAAPKRAQLVHIHFWGLKPRGCYTVTYSYQIINYSCKFSFLHELTGLWPNCSIWLLVSNMYFNAQPSGIIIPNDYMNLYDHIFEGLALPLKRALKPATRNSSPAPGTSCGLSFPMSSTSWLDPVRNASWCAPATLKTEGTKIV